MRILSSVLPAFGHFYPTVAFLQALQAAGHEVAVVSSASFTETIERAGLRAIASGLDWHESRPEMAFPEQADAFTDPATRSAMIGRIFSDVGPMRMTETVGEVFDSFQPDAFLASPMEYGAQLIAELRQIPIVMNFGLTSIAELPGFLPADRQQRELRLKETIRSKVAVIRQGLGLPPIEDAWVPPTHHRLVLCQTPPSLEPFQETLSHGPWAHQMRPVPYNDPVDDEPAFHPPGDGRPFVVVSLGTVFDHHPTLLTDIIQAIGDRATILVGTKSELGPVGDHVRVRRWLPMSEVLPRADLFVTHGGWGSTVGGMVAGVPELVLPLGAEQPVNAIRLRSTGAGLALFREERSLDQLRGCIDRLLGEPIFKMNAQRLADEVRGMPSPEDQVSLFEEAVSKGPRPGFAPFGPPIDRSKLPKLED
jgi:MGT family glycosyltransferase